MWIFAFILWHELLFEHYNSNNMCICLWFAMKLWKNDTCDHSNSVFPWSWLINGHENHAASPGNVLGQACQLISQNCLKTIGIMCIFKIDPLHFLTRATFWSKVIGESNISGRKAYENCAFWNATCSKPMKYASCIHESVVFIRSMFRNCL